MNIRNKVKSFMGIVFIMATVLMFTVCKKDSLDGTTWKSSDGYALTFAYPNLTLSEDDEDDDDDPETGTYTLSGKVVTISVDGENLTGTLSGNTLSFESEGITFTRSVTIKQPNQPRQNSQTLTAGKEFSTKLAPGAIHTYRIRLGTNPNYIIEWGDSDNRRGDYADIKVGLKKEGASKYIIPVDDDGNEDENKHRVNGFDKNSWYIIEVQGYDEDESGSYSIMFY
jgi:hypothetical protein